MGAALVSSHLRGARPVVVPDYHRRQRMQHLQVLITAPMDERRNSLSNTPQATSADGCGFDPSRFCRRFLSQEHNGLLQLRYVSHGADHVVLTAPAWQDSQNKPVAVVTRKYLIG